MTYEEFRSIEADKIGTPDLERYYKKCPKFAYILFLKGIKNYWHEARALTENVNVTER